MGDVHKFLFFAAFFTSLMNELLEPHNLFENILYVTKFLQDKK
jgi:hypothetical protein